jgi:hypothetical protein
MPGHLEQRATEFRIPFEALGTLDQPQIQLILDRPYIRLKLGMKTFRIVHQVTGMDFKKTGQQHAR